MRFERGEMQKRASGRAVELPHPWKDEELAKIEEDVLAESPRGANPRYWDDVQVGDEIDGITKGPLGLTDFIAFIAAGAAPIPRIAAWRCAAPVSQASSGRSGPTTHRSAGVLGALQHTRRNCRARRSPAWDPAHLVGITR
jgi:hypothetical protein